jgi:hypothetical protein
MHQINICYNILLTALDSLVLVHHRAFAVLGPYGPNDVGVIGSVNIHGIAWPATTFAHEPTGSVVGGLSLITE